MDRKIEEQNQHITLRVGDDYTEAIGRAIRFDIPPGMPDLAGATASMTLTPLLVDRNAYTVAGTIITDAPSPRILYSVGRDITSNLITGDPAYEYVARVTLLDGSVITRGAGVVRVLSGGAGATP